MWCIRKKINIPLVFDLTGWAIANPSSVQRSKLILDLKKTVIRKLIVSSTPTKKQYETSVASGKNEIDVNRAAEQTERLRLRL